MEQKLKKTAIFLLKLAVSGSLLYFVLKKAGVAEVGLLLMSIKPAAFVAAVLLYLVTLLLASMRWMLLLPDRFGLGRLFPLYLLGSFFNTFLPGLVGGDAVKIYYLYRETGKGTQALSSVFMDRYIGFTAMMILGSAAFPFGLKYFGGSWLEWVLPAIVACFVLGSITVFGLRIGRRFRVLRELYEYFHKYRKKRDVIAKALALSFTLQFLIIVAVYVLARGLGVTLPFTALIIFIPIITTVATMPVSLSGIGLREAASVLLLGTVGVGPGEATAISFAWFLMAAVGGLTGLFEYLRVRESGKPKTTV